MGPPTARRLLQRHAEPAAPHKLEGLHGWSWAPRDTHWRNGFEPLQPYVEEHGHARVPLIVTVDGFRLGAWVGEQRTVHARGGLAPGRRELLQGLPGWVWDARDDVWEGYFGHHIGYVDRHGNARLPVAYADEIGRLGHWVNNQRSRYRPGELEPDRQCRL